VKSERLSGLSLARICLAIAGGGALFLAIHSLARGAVAGCGPGSACDRVLSSPWAYWFGLPVSLPAIVIYGALARATWGLQGEEREGRRGKWWLAAVALSGLILAAALWFGWLQEFAIKSWCKYCLATHASAVLGSILVLRRAQRPRFGADPAGRALSIRPGLAPGFGLSLLGLTVLVAGQAMVKPRQYGLTQFSRAMGLPSRQLSLFGGRFQLDPDQLPLIGDPAAARFVVGLFDCTCEHCRHLHPLLNEVVAHYGGQVAIVALPMPLDADCNPMIPQTQPQNSGACDYARLALAVWRAKPAGFGEFDDWLFSPDGPPSLEDARAKAELLVGRSALERALHDPWVNHQVAVDVNLYIANSQAMGESQLPQLIFGDAGVAGEVDGAHELEQLIDSHAPLGRHT
jgi:uncharacterized membrane protein/protein-disulfide isomerase